MNPQQCKKLFVFAMINDQTNDTSMCNKTKNALQY